MLVTPENFSEVCSTIWNELELSIDNETSGLKPYQGSRLFSVIVATKTAEYYFNFNDSNDHLGQPPLAVLPREWVQILLTPIALNVLKTVYMANAKFDMHILAQEGVTRWGCTVHDVLVMDRLDFNDHIKYSLDAVAKRHGYEKSDAVEEYIKEHKLWRWVSIPGKKKRDKDKWYSKVPLEVIVPYGERDARITFDIGRKQREKFTTKTWEAPRPTPMNPYETELRLTKVLYSMEREGIPVSETLCIERAQSETEKYEAAAREFRDKTGVPLVDSAKVLTPIFNGLGLTPPKTDKGNDSLTDEWLETLEHPIARLIQAYRTHSKIANTYYRNFLWYRDEQGLVHANANQGGARTGRLSYSDPNLQNVPDSEVRDAFIPPTDFCFVSIDFDQQEYRVMLEYSRQMDVIRKVQAGLDIHTATAEMMGVERKPAKTLNFMLLYGGGVVKLAMALFPVTLGERELWAIWRTENGWEMEAKDIDLAETISRELWEQNLPHLYEAQRLKDLYFEKLPMVESWVERVKAAAKERGFVRDWTGRELHCKVKRFSYKMPNAIIQGGCSSVAKHAMIQLDSFLQGKKSKLLIQVHDEIMFKVHKDELDIVPNLKEIMENVFPHQHLKLTCSVSHSWESWGKLEDGYPGETTRDVIQGTSLGGPETLTQNVGA